MSDWAEAVAADGKKFYYHKVTRVSVWEKPGELKSYEAANAAGGSSSSSSSGYGQQRHQHQYHHPSSASASHLPPNWKEYISPEGKKYYHNELTKETRWEIPTATPSSSTSSFPDNNSSNNNNNNTSSLSSSTNINGSGKDGEKTGDSNVNIKELDRDGANRVFKELLTDNDVGSTWSFERAQKVIINDERYQVLKTMSERKAVFQDYLVDRKKFEFEEKRKRDKKNREEFVKMLRESPEVSLSMSWRRAQLYFDGDAKWDAVENEKDREDLFRSHILDLERQEKEDKEQIKREQTRQLRQKFENDPNINLKSQWRKVKDEYENDQLVLTMDKFEVLSTYESYIKDLEKKEEDIQRKDRERLKRDARKYRLLFREFLNEKYQSGELHAATKWKSFYKKFSSLAVFENLSTQSTGSTPLELFTDFQLEMEDNYDKDFKKLKDMVKDLDYQYVPKTTLEGLKEQLAKHEWFSLVMPSSFPPFLVYLEEREQKKLRELEKKRKEAVSDFKVLLEETSTISKHSKWADVKPGLVGAPDFERLDDDQEKEKIFNQYIEYLSNEESDEEGIIKSDGDDSGPHRETFSTRKRASTAEEADRKKKKERSHY